MARGSDYRRFSRGATKARAAPTPVADKIGVMVAVPSESGQLNWSIAHNFARMMWNAAQPGCPFMFEPLIQVGTRPIQYARNMIVDRFLKSDHQWLMMIDDDQVVPENFWQLLTVPSADIVSGKTFCWVGNDYKPGRLRVNQYDLIQREGIEYPECFNLFPNPNDTQPYQVPIVGTGCIAIRRHVLEGFGPNPFRFTYRADTQAIQGGEDVNFSVAANRMGFVIAIMPTVRFGHMKHIDLAQVEEYADAYCEFKVSGKTHQPVDVLSIGMPEPLHA